MKRHGGMVESNILLQLKEQDRSLYSEVFEANTYNVKPQELAGFTVIDIGANKGFFSILASLDGAKKIYALEPNLDNYKVLLSNCRDFNNIIPVNLAVSQPGLKQVCISNEGALSRIITEGDLVNCISLEEFMKILPQEIDLILKIDCEGSEYDILLPCPELIKRFKYIYSEVHNNMHPNKSYNHVMLEEFINNLGFKSEIINSVWGWIATDGTFTPFTTVDFSKSIKFTRI